MKKLIKPLLNKVIKKKKSKENLDLSKLPIRKVEIEDDYSEDEDGEREGYLFTGNTML